MVRPEAALNLNLNQKYKADLQTIIGPTKIYNHIKVVIIARIWYKSLFSINIQVMYRGGVCQEDVK